MALGPKEVFVYIFKIFAYWKFKDKRIESFINFLLKRQFKLGII